MPRTLFAAALFAPLLLILGCGSPEDPWKDVPGGPNKILVSFPPLYCFVKQVAGPHAAVLCLATSVGPHHYEPSTDDALKASKAKLILYNGLNLDDEKVTKLTNSSGNARAQVLAVGEKAVNPSARLKMGEIHHGDHTHPAGPDPHVWLGTEEATAMVRLISDTLQKLDPVHAAEFRQRADAYIGKIAELRARGEKLFKGKDAKIITMHESFGYFARGFKLKLLDAIQVQPGIEADAAKLKDLVDACRKETCRIVITTEPQYPKSAAHVLETELRKHNLNVRLAEVDTLETADPVALTRDPTNLDADFYLERMRQTIDNLAKAME